MPSVFDRLKGIGKSKKLTPNVDVKPSPNAQAATASPQASTVSPKQSSEPSNGTPETKPQQDAAADVQQSESADVVEELAPTKTSPRSKGQGHQPTISEFGRNLRSIMNPQTIVINQQDYKDVETKVIDAEMCQKLIDACSTEIRERGLETLGIFMPFRVDEGELLSLTGLHLCTDPDVIHRLVIIFFKQPEDFASELRFTSIHNVVGALKWALRHLKVQNESLLSLTMYQKLVEAEKSTDFSPKSYSTFASTLSPTSKSLLNSILSLCSSVASYSHINAMSGSKLVKMLAFTVFGLQWKYPAAKAFSKAGNADFDDAYNAWAKSANALEHIFLAYLRFEKTFDGSLPLRLQQMIDNYPPPPSVDPITNTSATTQHIQILRVSLLSPDFREYRQVYTPYEEASLMFERPGSVQSKDGSAESIYRRIQALGLEEASTEDALRVLTLMSQRSSSGGPSSNFAASLSTPNLLANVQSRYGTVASNKWKDFAMSGFNDNFDQDGVAGALGVEDSEQRPTPGRTPSTERAKRRRSLSQPVLTKPVNLKSDDSQADETSTDTPSADPSWLQFKESGFGEPAVKPEDLALEKPKETMETLLQKSNSSKSSKSLSSRRLTRKQSAPGKRPSRSAVGPIAENANDWDVISADADLPYTEARLSIMTIDETFVAVWMEGLVEGGQILSRLSQAIELERQQKNVKRKAAELKKGVAETPFAERGVPATRWGNFALFQPRESLLKQSASSVQWVIVEQLIDESIARRTREISTATTGTFGSTTSDTKSISASTSSRKKNRMTGVFSSLRSRKSTEATLTQSQLADRLADTSEPKSPSTEWAAATAAAVTSVAPKTPLASPAKKVSSAPAADTPAETPAVPSIPETIPPSHAESSPAKQSSPPKVEETPEAAKAPIATSRVDTTPTKAVETSKQAVDRPRVSSTSSGGFPSEILTRSGSKKGVIATAGIATAGVAATVAAATTTSKASPEEKTELETVSEVKDASKQTEESLPLSTDAAKEGKGEVSTEPAAEPILSTTPAVENGRPETGDKASTLQQTPASSTVGEANVPTETVTEKETVPSNGTLPSTDAVPKTAAIETSKLVDQKATQETSMKMPEAAAIGAASLAVAAVSSKPSAPIETNPEAENAVEPVVEAKQPGATPVNESVESTIAPQTPVAGTETTTSATETTASGTQSATSAAPPNGDKVSTPADVEAATDSEKIVDAAKVPESSNGEIAPAPSIEAASESAKATSESVVPVAPVAAVDETNPTGASASSIGATPIKTGQTPAATPATPVIPLASALPVTPTRQSSASTVTPIKSPASPPAASLTPKEEKARAKAEAKAEAKAAKEAAKREKLSASGGKKGIPGLFARMRTKSGNLIDQKEKETEKEKVPEADKSDLLKESGATGSTVVKDKVAGAAIPIAAVTGVTAATVATTATAATATSAETASPSTSEAKEPSTEAGAAPASVQDNDTDKAVDEPKVTDVNIEKAEAVETEGSTDATTPKASAFAEDKEAIKADATAGEQKTASPDLSSHRLSQSTDYSDAQSQAETDYEDAEDEHQGEAVVPVDESATLREVAIDGKGASGAV